MKTIITSLLLWLALLAPTSSFATLSMRISADNGVTWTNVTDVDANGTVLFVGVFSNWNLTIQSGVSKPFMGSAGFPVMDLNSTDNNLNSLTPGVLIVQLSDTDFAPAFIDGKFVTKISGFPGGEVNVSTWGDTLNRPFENTVPISTLGPIFPGNPFASNTVDATIGASPYSLTLQVVVSHPLPAITTLDTSLVGYPCECPFQVTCPNDVALNCGSQTGTNFTGMPTVVASTNCDAPVISYNDVTTPGNCPANYVITRTWTVTPSCGPASNCVQIITVTDTNPPTITCANNKTVQCNDPWTFDEPTFGDGCSAIQSVTSTTTTNAANCGFVATRTWTVTDACGNSAQCSQSVTVVDTVPPQISCFNTKIVECGAGWSFDTPTATDNCGTPNVVVWNTTTNGTACERTITRTWRAIDSCGNYAECSQSIVIRDSTPPQITCPAPKTVECGTAWSFGTPTASDTCSGATITTVGITTNGTACNQTITKKWRATDGCGNYSECTQTITIKDTTPPTITCLPNTSTTNCTPLVYCSYTQGGWGAPPCGNNPGMLLANNFAWVYPSGVEIGIAGSGGFSIKFTSASAIQTFLPSGGTAGALTADLVNPPTSPAGVFAAQVLALKLNVDFSAAGITGGSSGPLGNLVYNDPSSPLHGKTINQILAIANTLLGGGSAPGFTISIVNPIVDGLNNAFDNCQTTAWAKSRCSNISLCTVTNTPTAPQVNDNCDPHPLVTYKDSPSTNGCGSAVIRTWYVSDNCGNTNTCTQTIITTDNIPPVITCSTNKTVDCSVSSWSFDLPTASDNSGKAPTITIVSTVTNAASCGFTATRTWKATDACGNIATCSQTVSFGCAPCVGTTFDFTPGTSSALYGTAGNVRTFTMNGVSVKATAFSRTTAGAWATAYLGQYSGGLGVTDTSEGDGSNNKHTVDNLDRLNYVLFEFSTPVILQSTYLGYVVSDSDIRVWIGNFTDPYNNHLTLSDAVLTSFGYSEDNTTTLTTTRTATLNAGARLGNAIIIAARPGDATLNDQFKIQKLGICKPTCTPPPPPCAGSICGSVLRDCDANGSLSGEAGLGGWTVQLKNSGGTVIQTQTTSAAGAYCFTNLSAGTYSVAVVIPANYSQTVDPDGTKDCKTTVTLANCEAKSGFNFGFTGTAPSVKLVVTGPSSANCGDTITYTFAVTNTGNTCVYGGMSVYAPLLGGQIWAQTPVAPGQGYVFTKTYVVKTTDAGTLVLNAYAVGCPPGMPNVTNSVSLSTAVACNSQTPGPTCLVANPGCNVVNLSWLGVTGASNYKVKRSYTKGGPYSVIATVTTLSYNDTTVTNGAVYYYVVSAIKNAAETQVSNEASAFPSAGGPAGWATADIGAVAATGGASFVSPKLWLAGSGADIWNTSDEFRYAYTPSSGDCSIIARVSGVQNTDPWAKAGVMIRESLAANARHVSLFITPANGASLQARTIAGNASVSTTVAGPVAPYWVKLVRTGNLFTGYYSANGMTWTQIGNQTIAMPANAYIGFAITSHNDGVLNVSTFDNMTVTP